MIFNRVVPNDPDLLDTATAARASDAPGRGGGVCQDRRSPTRRSFDTALAEPAPGDAVSLVCREAELVSQGREFVRTEALVTVMKELASEMRSVRSAVDQLKAVVAKMRLLTDARRATSPVVGHVRTPQ